MMDSERRFGLSEQTIADISNVLAKHPNVEEAILFGSRAKGCHKPGSDIDLALRAEGLTFSQAAAIVEEIYDTGLLYEVDLVDINRNHGTPLGDHIARVGKLFYRRGRA